MTPKTFFFQRILIWELKNAEFDADFESIEKVREKNPTKKVISLKV